VIRNFNTSESQAASLGSFFAHPALGQVVNGQGAPFVDMLQHLVGAKFSGEVLLRLFRTLNGHPKLEMVDCLHCDWLDIPGQVGSVAGTGKWLYIGRHRSCPRDGLRLRYRRDNVGHVNARTCTASNRRTRDDVPSAFCGNVFFGSPGRGHLGPGVDWRGHLLIA